MPQVIHKDKVNAPAKSPASAWKEPKIIKVYFRDGNGNEWTRRPKYGEKMRIYIESENMINRKIKVKIYDKDTVTNDLLHEEDRTITGSPSFHTISLTKAMQDKGGDAWYQNIFAEVSLYETQQKVKSEVIDVDKTDFSVPKPEGKKPVTRNAQEQKEKDKNCVCKQYDLIWGAKVSCEFRKKVVEISKRQNIDANLLMAAMAHETGGTFDTTCGTFKKHKDESKEGYVGLIQIGKDAAFDIGITRTELLNMTQIKQLDYVEKYLKLPMVKGKLNTLTDFYLAILFPVDCGKGNQPNHIVFDNSLSITYKNGKPVKNLNYWRNVGYNANPVFHKEGKNEKGKTYVWEIADNIKIWYDKGTPQKAKVFECQKAVVGKTIESVEKGTWNVIITEQYTGKSCEHIDKTPKRANCRKGKIEIYDHNKNIVLTISDCLLEGIAGSDRMITNADVPFGTYKINDTTPFYNTTNRTSYGPNPRLVFEPIKGSGDEADKSKRSLIRIHGGRQETKDFKPQKNPSLKRTQGCIRVWDADAKKLYDWWREYSKESPNVKPGKVIIRK